MRFFLKSFCPYLDIRGTCSGKALIFKKSDVEDLREKLQEACDHPEMVMKMKNQAADFICEKYNWDEVVKENLQRNGHGVRNGFSAQQLLLC